MAFAITHFWPGGTQAQYDAVIAAVHPNGGADLPKGQLFHAGGPCEGGYLIMAVHDSRATGLAGGFTTPAVETDVDLHTLWIAK